MIPKTLKILVLKYCSFLIHVWKGRGPETEVIETSDQGKRHSVDHTWSSEGQLKEVDQVGLLPFDFFSFFFCPTEPMAGI